MSLASFSLILGVICYVFGFPLVFTDEKHLAWRRAFVKDENILRFIAVAVISVAVTTLRYQHTVSWDGEGILVLFVWLTLLKGLFMAWWPAVFGSVAAAMEERFLGNQVLQMFVGFIMVLLGALFTYFGFIIA